MKIKSVPFVFLTTYSLALAAEPAATAPAGDLPTITIDGDKFVADGKEFKIWGFNMGHGLYLSDLELQRQADQLEFLGVNLLRIHTIDWTLWGDGPDADGNAGPSGLLPIGPDRADTRHLVNVDRFFRFADALRAKRIYLAITLAVCSNYVPGDADILQTTPEDKAAWIAAINDLNAKGPDLQAFKILPAIDERALALRKEWAANLLSLRNPKTGLKLAEDPQLAFLNAVNECSCWSTFYRNLYHRSLPEYFLKKYRNRWNRWLKEKYGTDKKLAAAWKQEGRKGLLEGESLDKASVDLLPLDPISLPDEERPAKGFPAFSEARRLDYVRFSFEVDAEHQRALLEHYRSLGWTRPCIYGDTVGISPDTGQFWLDSGLLPHIEEHPYDEANIDPFMWDKIRICTYCGANFVDPLGLDRPIWGSEFREGAGWVSWTRIPTALYAAVYHSIQGRDGLAWHVWSMTRAHILNDPLMTRNLSWCHCNWDIPWLFAYRAAGRLFRSCEIRPLDRKDPARTRFAEQWGGKCSADFSNDQVCRVSGENRAIMTVKTDHFRAVATPYPQAVEFVDLIIKLTSKTNNVVVVEKLDDNRYEVTAIGTSGGMETGKSIHFDPLEFVAGAVAFRDRTIKSIEHVNHLGEVIERAPGHGSEMPFIPYVRLYRVTLNR